MSESDKIIKGEKYLWTSEKTKLLIKKTERYPELWNTKIKDFKNKIKKQNALKNLAEDFETTEEEIRRKLHNLRTQLGQEVNKARKRKIERGTDTYVSKWEFYNAMKYMVCSYVPKNTQNNLSFKATAESGKNESEPTVIFCKTVEMPTEPANIQNRHKKRKTEENNPPNDVIFQSLLQILLQKASDEHQIFGDYIASELRGFKNDSSRKKLKQLIQMSILQVSEEDENSNKQNTDST